MALLATFEGWNKLIGLRHDRMRVVVEDHREDTTRARQLGLGERRRARSDVAAHALNTRVGRKLVGHELRLHDHMTDLAAKLPRVHVLDATVGPERYNVTTLAVVNAKTSTAVMRWVGSLRSTRRYWTGAGGLPAARRRRSRHAPSGMRPRPMRNSAGRIRKKTMPM